MNKLAPHYYTDKMEAGCDEAGRGCLAGSVYAAAVILPRDYDNPALNDSKQLSMRKRYALREQIQRDAVAWAVGIVTPEEIDDVNILHASFLAMHRAIDRLRVCPEALIIDGNRFDPVPARPRKAVGKAIDGELAAEAAAVVGEGGAVTDDAVISRLPYTCIIHGDARYQAIAAASILAKTCRDDYMDRIDAEFPMYGWKKNKGYPTKGHRMAIEKYGITKYHRRSFNLLGDRQLELDFG